MSFPAGRIAYRNTAANVSVTGLTLSEDQLAVIVREHATTILFDKSGTDALREALEGIAETDFEKANLEAALQEPKRPQSWEVGEAIAQACTANHAKCSFPWPMRRDQRNPSANQPGSDLVGFQDTGAEPRRHRFAFGEVKTSRQPKSPPSVVHGRCGLTRQLRRLRDVAARKHHLMKYLGYRARKTPWWLQYKSASGRLLASPDDVTLFGVLVRDVAPDQRDLGPVAAELGKNCPDCTVVDLRAIYLPNAAIPGLAELALPVDKAK